MLLTGQPLHAFDLDRVAGGALTVRRAREGEQVQTLDGQTRTLDGEMVLIEDADGPTSIAGVMGGARSEVQPRHHAACCWRSPPGTGPNIHRTSWALGLRSEASGRFEKGLAAGAVHARAGRRLPPDGRAVRREHRAGTIDVGRRAPPPGERSCCASRA